jgi:hypothetical protein
MNFGGTNGHQLRYLIRITAFLHWETGFHGFSFCHNNNEQITIGKRSLHNERGKYCPCVEPIFIID